MGSFPVRCWKQREVKTLRGARLISALPEQHVVEDRSQNSQGDQGLGIRLWVNRAQGQRSGLTVGGRSSWPLPGHAQVSWGHVRRSVLGSHQGGYPGVGPFAAADLGGRWSPGQSWPQACGCSGQAGPPHGLQMPLVSVVLQVCGAGSVQKQRLQL